MKEDEESGGQWKIAVPIIVVIVAVVVMFSPEESTFQTAGQRLDAQGQLNNERENETTLADDSPSGRAIAICREHDLADVELVQGADAVVESNDTGWLVLLPKTGGGNKRCNVSSDGESVLQAFAE